MLQNQTPFPLTYSCPHVGAKTTVRKNNITDVLQFDSNDKLHY